MTVYESPVIYNATKGLITNKCLDIIDVHEILGYCELDQLQKTAKIHSLKLRGDMKYAKIVHQLMLNRRMSIKCGRVEVRFLVKGFI